MFIIISIMIALVACNNGSTNEDVKLLSDEKLIDVIYDIHIADGLLTANVLPKEEIYNDTNIYYSVFKKHDISKKQFDATIDYYIKNDYRKLEMLYDDVLEKLNTTKGELQAQ
jgi:hypothetical protein